MTKQIPRWLKQLLIISGLLAAMPVALAATGFICGGTVAVFDGSDDLVIPAIALLMAALVLGLSAGGTTLALLLILGLLALWLGRATAQQLIEGEELLRFQAAEFEISDKAIAIWGLACLVAIVPAGIAGLKLVVW